MNTLSIEAVAQDIVNAIKPLVGNRTINVMNVEGVIIASSDPRRVGTFHKGAADAAGQRRVVRISPSEVGEYPGAKEGINLPVVKNGEVLGVVGIYGVPEEVEQAANLLGVCVDLYLDQAHAARKTQLRKDMRLALIRRMLLGEMLDREELLAGGRELSLDLRLPMRAAVATAGRKSHGPQYGIELLNRMYAAVGRGGWLDDNRDVFAIVDNALVMFKHTPPGFDGDAFVSALHAALGEELGVPLTVALGGQCDDWRQLILSHHEAQTLAELYVGACVNIDSRDSAVTYMLSGCMRAGVAERRLAPPYQALRRGFGDGEMDRVMATVRA